MNHRGPTFVTGASFVAAEILGRRLGLDRPRGHVVADERSIMGHPPGLLYVAGYEIPDRALELVRRAEASGWTVVSVADPASYTPPVTDELVIEWAQALRSAHELVARVRRELEAAAPIDEVERWTDEQRLARDLLGRVGPVHETLRNLATNDVEGSALARLVKWRKP